MSIPKPSDPVSQLNGCFRHPALDVLFVPGKGRGVIATDFIPQSTVLEIAPVVLVPHVHLPAYQTLPLFDYSFEWDDETDAILFGLISFVNHHASNVNIRLEHDKERLLTTIVTTKNIQKGEELLYDYQCPLWFDVKE